MRKIIATIITFVGLMGLSWPTFSQETVKVTVGMLPSANSSPFMLGIKKGFFKEVGLDVEPQIMQGGSELTVALMSGATQFSHIGSVNAVIARSKGLPIKVIAFYLKEQNVLEETYMRIVVRPDSGIKSVKDLVGKTIASNEVRAYGEVVIKASLELQGVNPSSIKLTEIPFPDMAGALKNNHVDAIWTLEPFLTVALDGGAVAIDAPAMKLAGNKNFLDGAWMTTERYIASNPDVVDRFVRAMNKSTEYAAAHLDEIRDIIPTYTRVRPELARRIKLPKFDATVDREMIQTISNYALKYGIIDKPVTAAQLLR
jgi:NitT/TauT family transport system substrate-binding protein